MRWWERSGRSRANADTTPSTPQETGPEPSVHLRFARRLAAAIDVRDVAEAVAAHVVDLCPGAGSAVYEASGSGEWFRRAMADDGSDRGVDWPARLDLQLDHPTLALAGTVAQAKDSGPVSVPWRVGGAHRQEAPATADNASDPVGPHLVAAPVRDDDGDVIAVICAVVDQPAGSASTCLTELAEVTAPRLGAALITERLSRSVRHLEDERIALERLALTDDLTGLGNGREFERCVSDMQGDDGPCCAAVLNLDNYGRLVTTHGDRSGEEVLLDVADIIRDAIDGRDVVAARLGPDEFGLAAPGTDIDAFDAVVGSVVAGVRAHPWSFDAVLESITISAGSAVGDAASSVVEHAREALLLAKAEGGGHLLRFTEFDPRSQALREDRYWADRIREAISSDRFSLQGQAVARTGDPAGDPRFVEVLLRYHALDGSVQAPGRFLTSAARFGLLEQIDAWVIHKTVGWLARTASHVELSLNVSPTSFMSGFALREAAAELTARHVDPARLIMEIPASAAVADPHQFKASLAALRSVGIKTAIDGIGDGWAAAAVLRDNPVDLVKIDGSWVRRAATEKLAETVVRSMIECAHLVGAEVVAEWVENETTMRLMASLDVACVQGFYVGKPVPLAQLISSGRGSSLDVERTG